MPVFKTNLEVRPASDEEIKIYYETTSRKINLLFEKYDIRDANGELAKVSADQIRALLSLDSFFQSTPLKSIFFDQKQQFVLSEIIHAFQSIISDPPAKIKAIFFDTFITLLTKKGWDKSLSAYFEKQYNFPSDGTIVLEDLKDFSVGFGVYRATFQLSTPRRERVIVFLKRAYDTRAYNELLYFHLQKELLSTASYAKMPCIISNTENTEALLLSPLIPGITSDTALTLLTRAYRDTTNNSHKITLKISLEVLIEAFISHAVLGDLLGRNDRHLMNSMIASVVDGVPQNNTPEDLNTPEKILAYANHIVTMKTKAISLIDFDLKWLLGEKNVSWTLADIDFGLAELNLLSLLPEFNDYNSKTNPFYEKRKEYIAHYFSVYCQQLEALLEKRELLVSAIKKIYPLNISEEKLKRLTQRINLFEKSKEPIITLFKRYLLNFRIRLVYKETLIALGRIAKETNNTNLLNALQQTGLLKYLPPSLSVDSHKSNVFLQLQCFRGVLSKEDMAILSEKDRPIWEIVASNITMIAEKYNGELFKALEDKKQFIMKDTEALLNPHYSCEVTESIHKLTC